MLIPTVQDLLAVLSSLYYCSDCAVIIEAIAFCGCPVLVLCCFDFPVINVENDFIGDSVLALLSWLHCSHCSVITKQWLLVALLPYLCCSDFIFLLYCPGCIVLAVLSCLYCLGCTVQLHCSDCHYLTNGLYWLYCNNCPTMTLMAVQSCLLYLSRGLVFAGCPVTSVQAAL